MKRILCMVLAVVLLILCVSATVGAEGAEDKISPELRALIAANPGGGIENGVVVEIYHHNPNYPTDGISEETAAIIQDNPKHPLTNEEKTAVENNLKAQAELIAQIGEITYMEPDGFTIGRCYIGLPYVAIEKVALLENVDYIDLPRDEGSVRAPEQKTDELMEHALKSYSASATVRLTLKLAYTPHPYIGVPAPGIDGSKDEINAFIDAYNKANEAYYSAKNAQYAAAIAASADVKIISCDTNNIYILAEAKLNELDKIIALKEVDFVGFSGFVNDPHDAPQVLTEKFEQWMLDTKGIVKWDPDRPKTDPDYWRISYTDYDELYVTDEWALVFAKVNIYDPWEEIGHICIGNRVISWYGAGAAVYPYGYFVYSAAEDTFYPIERFVYPVTTTVLDENGRPTTEVRILEPMLSFDDYPGFMEVLDELNIGVLRGDADLDGKVTILDATHIQRYKANMVALTGMNLTSADADDDGIVTVLDATRIQRTIAEMCSIDGTPKAASPTEPQAEPPTELYFDN